MNILIIGASGMIAQETIKELAKAGNKLRLFSRTIKAENYPNHDVIQGDVMIKEDLQKAVLGCEAIHITVNTPDEEAAVNNIIAVAKVNDIKRISYVSGAAMAEKNSWFPLVGKKFRAEQALKSSGIPYMIFRPTWFMESLAMMIQNGKAIVMGKQPIKLHWVSAIDFGKQLAKAYGTEHTINKEFYSFGPETLTLNNALEEYVRVKHPEIKKVGNMPFGLLKFIAFVTRNKQLKEVIPMFEYFKKTADEGESGETNSHIGSPSTTLKDWLNSSVDYISTAWCILYTFEDKPHHRKLWRARALKSS